MSCSAVQTIDDIDPDFLWKDYTYFSGQTQKILDHFADFVSEARQISGNYNGTVLDIGSNDGSLLKEFKRYGYNVKGIDPAS